jgi:hypothetical protein
MACVGPSLSLSPQEGRRENASLLNEEFQTWFKSRCVSFGDVISLS